MLSLLCLFAAALALWLWYLCSRQQGGGTGGGAGAGSGTPTGARVFAPTAAATLLGLYVGTAVWLGRMVGVGASLEVCMFLVVGGGLG